MEKFRREIKKREVARAIVGEPRRPLNFASDTRLAFACHFIALLFFPWWKSDDMHGIILWL